MTGLSLSADKAFHGSDSPPDCHSLPFPLRVLPKQKAPKSNKSLIWVLYGRDDRTRTCGIVLPKHARYHLRYISIKIYNSEQQVSVALPVVTEALPSQKSIC